VLTPLIPLAAPNLGVLTLVIFVQLVPFQVSAAPEAAVMNPVAAKAAV